MPSMHPAGVRRSQSHDLSIVGDEQEQHRIQLEHNLQRYNDLSLHLSSSKDECSMEYPRHTDHHSPYSAFPSFHRHSEDNFDPEDQSQVHHWSYRAPDDDDNNSVYPYAMETLSTAAHHASALTFTAGLANRRDQTQSGAEYDPDRPLHHIIAGVDTNLSMLGNTRSKSNNITSGQFMFDPLVVDDSVQLDRVLETGRAPPHTLPTQFRSPLASPMASSSSSISSAKSPRPKLSDALHQVAFSPKRPRSAQSFISTRAHRSHPRPLFPSPAKVSFDVPTPRARSKNPSQPHVNVQPPTPNSTNSKFTRLARGLAREIEAEKGRRGIVKQSPKGRIYLPDVTGLTSAVESPVKARLEYHRYDGRGDRECEARILATLSVVQSRLAFLESENSVSRRRVKELELELEACKQEVARERTRILALEVEDVERQHAASMKAHKERKGKAKEYLTGWEGPSRYKEAVEEKKALEALIFTLRSHLARLTSELSSHQALLTELRSLRDADARALQSKSEDVELLRDRVERLAGEVEVLKGVVEEGLKERRMVRDQSIASSDASSPSDKSNEQAEDDQNPRVDEISDESPPHDKDLLSHTPSRSYSCLIDKTIRTDYATVGSSHQTAKPFINNEEVERISFELDERRSIRSPSSAASSISSQQRSLSYTEARSHSRPRSPSERSASSSPHDVNNTIDRPSSPDVVTPLERAVLPSAPAPSHSYPSGNSQKQQAIDDKNLGAPFPQIRGGRLERLFFSAPEHNAHTCNVCHRKRHRNDHGARERTASWLPSRFAAQFRSKVLKPPDDDEGYAEGSEEHEDRFFSDPKGKCRENVHFDDIAANLRSNVDQNKLPPQTVLARVLGELEDDFTHYKGIYVELSDQYKLMDAVSNVAKRNVLAEHLREVIDILEQKGDQIASLYDLLTFEDKPLPYPIDPGRRRAQGRNEAGGTQRAKSTAV